MFLIERDHLIDRLVSVAENARSGRGALVVISGEAGAGKTSLVRHVFSTIPAVWGYCEPLSTPRPLGPFRDISHRLWGDRNPDPNSGDVGVVDMGDRLLARLRSDPVPLVIEDAHWIDAASADVLRFLGRRIAATNGLVVVTCRDELGVDHTLRRIVGELATSPGFVRLDVPALSESAVAQMVSQTGVAAAEAFALTGGNAFLVGQLIEASATVASSPMVDSDRVTASVRDATAARLMPLSATTRGLVEWLSVIPGRVTSALIGDWWPSLDEAAVAGLIQVDGSVVEFRHELVRLAVQAGLTPGRQKELHAETFRRMLALGDVEPASLAFHARAAHDLTQAYSNECAAAERAVSLGAHREGAAHYRRALGDAASGELRDERSHLWLALSAEERTLGHDEEALKAAQQAVLLRPPGSDPLRRGAAIRWLAQVTPSESGCYRLARSAVELLEPLGPTRELAAAYALVGTNRMLARDLTAAKAWARTTIELASRIDDQPSMVSALQTLGSALTIDGEESDGHHLREAVELAREAGLDSELGRAYSNFVSATGEAKLYALSNGIAAEAISYFLARDVDGDANYTRAWHARCLFEQGDWSQAGELADAVLGAPGGAKLIAMITAWCTHSRIRIRRGEGGFADGLDKAKAVADATESLQRMAPVAAARAEARWLAGEKDDGTDGLTRCFEMALDRSHGWLTGELGLWMWRHGLLDAVPDVAAEPYRLQPNDPVAAGEAWRALGCPYETADSWCESTDEEKVREALAIFTRLGSGPGRKRASRRLRELGVRAIPRGPRGTTAVHPLGLTSREQEVLPLLVDGFTDADIAARLHLSAKTVGHHVSAVLRKTGSRSRRDLRGRDT